MSQATKSFSETARATNSTSRARRRDDPDRNITPVEATRGIYIDFEALSGEETSIVGNSVEESLVQVVTDARLQSAADAKVLPVTPFGHLMSELHERAVTADRRIVAFSQHELRVTEKWCGIDLGDRYADGRKIGKRWFNRLEPCTRPTEWSLAELEKCLGIERPPHFGISEGRETAKGHAHAAWATVRVRFTHTSCQGEMGKTLGLQRRGCRELGPVGSPSR